MGLIDNLRKTVSEKAKGVSSKMEKSYREHLDGELTNRKKEIEELEGLFRIREDNLNSRILDISAREANLKKYYLVPRNCINIPVGFMLLAALLFGIQTIAPKVSNEPPQISIAPPKTIASTKKTVSIPSYRDCLSKGITYYKEIGSYPYLSTGENASQKVEDICSRTNGMAFSYDGFK